MFIIVLMTIFYSCSNKNDGYFKHETVNTLFYIEEIYIAKYSKVKGYIIYNNIKVPIDNGGNGYYYKKYNLKNGDKINTRINIYYYSTAYGYELVFDDVDISNYEINYR